MKYGYNYSANKHAGIRSRICRNGKARTETYRRDYDAMNIAVTTDERNNSTKLFIDTPDGDTIRLDGRTVRTLYRMLTQHFVYTDKPL